MWCTRRQVTLSLTHPRLAECNSRLAIQARSNHSNRMVPSPRDLPSHLFPVAPAPSGPVCHQVPDPQAWAVDALSLSWEGLDPYAFPPAAILGKVVEKLQDYPCNRIILIAPGWPNMPWFWDLVAMSSQIPLCLLPTQPAQSGNSVIQPDPTQEPGKPEPSCLAPRATATRRASLR